MTNVTHKFLSMCLLLTLYVFRTHCAHHQERQILSIQPLVTVALCWWSCRVQSSAHDTATNTERQLSEIVLTKFVSPDDEHNVFETRRELIINT